MFKLFRVFPLLILLFFLLTLCFPPAVAYAKTQHKYQKPPKIATVLIKESTWEPGYDYFAPSNLSCKIRTPCFVFVNKTYAEVQFQDTAGNTISLPPGGTATEMYQYIGTRYYTATTINVPLAVHVHA